VEIRKGLSGYWQTAKNLGGRTSQNTSERTEPRTFLSAREGTGPRREYSPGLVHPAATWDADPEPMLGEISAVKMVEVDRDGRMSSALHHAPIGRETRATCISDYALHGQDRRSPHPACHCGFYACKRGKSSHWSYAYHLGPWSLRATAYAEVSLWGRVFEGGSGYRAEWQRIDKLYLPTDFGSMHEWRHEVDGIPVHRVSVGELKEREEVWRKELNEQ
jgi:hypothetical protein